MNNLAEQLLFEDKGGKNLHLEHREEDCRQWCKCSIASEEHLEGCSLRLGSPLLGKEEDYGDQGY